MATDVLDSQVDKNDLDPILVVAIIIIFVAVLYVFKAKLDKSDKLIILLFILIFTIIVVGTRPDCKTPLLAISLLILLTMLIIYIN